MNNKGIIYFICLKWYKISIITMAIKQEKVLSYSMKTDLNT